MTVIELSPETLAQANQAEPQGDLPMSEMVQIDKSTYEKLVAAANQMQQAPGAAGSAQVQPQASVPAPVPAPALAPAGGHELIAEAVAREVAAGPNGTIPPVGNSLPVQQASAVETGAAPPPVAKAATWEETT